MRAPVPVLSLGLCWLLVACGGADEGQEPVRALLSFVGSIERSTHEPAFREQAYQWLDRGSREELGRRAALARSLAGRELESWEMLVPGRLSLSSSELKRRDLRAKISGNKATIALGDSPPVVLVREPGGWRVHLLDAEPN